MKIARTRRLCCVADGRRKGAMEWDENKKKENSCNRISNNLWFLRPLLRHLHISPLNFTKKFSFKFYCLFSFNVTREWRKKLCIMLKGDLGDVQNIKYPEKRKSFSLRKFKYLYFITNRREITLILLFCFIYENVSLKHKSTHKHRALPSAHIFASSKLITMNEKRKLWLLKGPDVKL